MAVCVNMLNSLEDSAFFSADLTADLRALGLSASTARQSMAALMLSPLLELSTGDRVTSPTEFEAIENYLRQLEEEFELATRDEMEAIGTDMGMLPMVPGSWDRKKFVDARKVLAKVLRSLPQAEAHEVRSTIAQGCRHVASAEGGSLINLYRVSAGEKPLIAEIVESLELDNTAEGLHLLERAGLR